MKEQLTEYATALLAKQKGFNWECDHVYLICDYGIRCVKLQYYEGDGSGVVTNTGLKDSTFSFDETKERLMCTAPTQSLLQKWLRDKHDMSIEVSIDQDGWNCHVRSIKDGSYLAEMSTYWYETYEEALEVGNQEALKLV